ncbi:hypothetical protein RHMOL_Rhmol13G0193500 [Rhododendron molle]|uniref:Uncharacterized protein n=1 Tax=Rhododendron molle TaxID=49168 RepID=A0ACC0L8G4_RHOML|nr:hypothetical protein RHMOL_Rhmol13G0193500 [Rhododendron molle]
MASLFLRVPTRNFYVSASSNGAPPGVPQQGGPVILEIPLDKIRRPLLRTRSNDPQKVKELMDSIAQIGLQVPIDVLEVEGVYYGITSVELLRAICMELSQVGSFLNSILHAGHVNGLVVMGACCKLFAYTVGSTCQLPQGVLPYIVQSRNKCACFRILLD